jgi:hypothetical protein
LQELVGASKRFLAVDWGQEPYRSQLVRNCIAEGVVELRVGAQVMLLRNVNLNAGLGNGSVGKVRRLRAPAMDKGMSEA